MDFSSNIDFMLFFIANASDHSSLYHITQHLDSIVRNHYTLNSRAGSHSNDTFPAQHHLCNPRYINLAYLDDSKLNHFKQTNKSQSSVSINSIPSDSSVTVVDTCGTSSHKNSPPFIKRSKKQLSRRASTSPVDNGKTCSSDVFSRKKFFNSSFNHTSEENVGSPNENFAFAQMSKECSKKTDKPELAIFRNVNAAKAQSDSDNANKILTLSDKSDYGLSHRDKKTQSLCDDIEKTQSSDISRTLCGSTEKVLTLSDKNEIVLDIDDKTQETHALSDKTNTLSDKTKTEIVLAPGDNTDKAQTLNGNSKLSSKKGRKNKKKKPNNANNAGGQSPSPNFDPGNVHGPMNPQDLPKTTNTSPKKTMLEPVPQLIGKPVPAYNDLDSTFNIDSTGTYLDIKNICSVVHKAISEGHSLEDPGEDLLPEDALTEHDQEKTDVDFIRSPAAKLIGNRIAVYMQIPDLLFKFVNYALGSKFSPFEVEKTLATIYLQIA